MSAGKPVQPTGRPMGEGALMDPKDQGALADFHFAQGVGAAAAHLRAQAKAFRTAAKLGVVGELFSLALEEAAYETLKVKRP